MNENVIKYVEEITDTRIYKRLGDEPFYIFLLSKTSDSPTSISVSAKSLYNNEERNIPITANVWNPILIQVLDVTQDVLDKYSVFIGLTDIMV